MGERLVVLTILRRRRVLFNRGLRAVCPYESTPRTTYGWFCFVILPLRRHHSDSCCRENRPASRKHYSYLSDFLMLIDHAKMMMYGFFCTCIGMTLVAVGTSKDTYSYGILATFGIFFFQYNL